MFEYVMWFLLICFLVIIFSVVSRTISFKPKATKAKQAEEILFDKEKSVLDLQEMIRCKTVSCRDSEQEDEAQFAKFVQYIQQAFPLVHKAASVEYLGKRGLLYCIKGKSPLAPTVFMSHYDVVSAEQSGWSKPAFDAVIENGYMWGRGTLDTKQSLNAILQSAEHLLSNGFVPQNDMYLSFAGNEEIGGEDAPAIVALLKSRGVAPAFVLDEGGAVTENVFPGASGNCAVVGTAEKGMLNIEYTCLSSGGHASAPKPHTCIGELAKACVNVEKSPFDGRLAVPVAEMLDCLGRYSSFLYRMIFANLWLFKPLLFAITKKSGGELSALMRTTVAFTMCEGSKGANVLPAKATLVSNSRILIGETAASTINRIKHLVNNENITLKILNSNEPSKISKTTGTKQWETLCDIINQTFGDIPVTPYMMFACSDSRHFCEISDYVYRFSAVQLASDIRSTIHGHDERIPIEGIYKCVEFYIRLMQLF